MLDQIDYDLIVCSAVKHYLDCFLRKVQRPEGEELNQ